MNVNAVNVFCDTPLSKALKDQLYDMSEIIKLLLEHGADPNFEAPLSPHAQRKGPCRPVFAAIENGEAWNLSAHDDNLSSLTVEVYEKNALESLLQSWRYPAFHKLRDFF